MRRTLDGTYERPRMLYRVADVNEAHVRVRMHLGTRAGSRPHIGTVVADTEEFAAWLAQLIDAGVAFDLETPDETHGFRRISSEEIDGAVAGFTALVRRMFG